jgi:peptide/nickel transport system permease protein
MEPRYIVRRLLQTALLMFLILTGLFLLFKAMPGSLASALATTGASPEYIANFRSRWGLDDPLHVQYWRFIKNYATLQFGTSMKYNQPVLEYVSRKIFNSFILVAPALTLAYLLGTLLGLVIGTKRGSKTERFGMVPVIIAGSTPGFFIGILLVIVFALKLNLFPTSGMLSGGTALEYSNTWYGVYFTKDFLTHYILPFTAVLLRYLYVPMLLMRTSVIEVGGQDFSYYHRITGLPKLRQLKHIAKHASLPVVTNFPLSFAKSFGGLVIIETVFNWPGIGFALLQAVLQRDLPVVRFVFALVAFVIVFGNFTVDIVYGYIDPRVSVQD